jgi:hypothetical protein
MTKFSELDNIFDRNEREHIFRVEMNILLLGGWLNDADKNESL